jgi:hypothetical protein
MPRCLRAGAGTARALRCSNGPAVVGRDLPDYTMAPEASAADVRDLLRSRTIPLAPAAAYYLSTFFYFTDAAGNTPRSPIPTAAGDRRLRLHRLQPYASAGMEPRWCSQCFGPTSSGTYAERRAVRGGRRWRDRTLVHPRARARRQRGLCDAGAAHGPMACSTATLCNGARVLRHHTCRSARQSATSSTDFMDHTWGLPELPHAAYFKATLRRARVLARHPRCRRARTQRPGTAQTRTATAALWAQPQLRESATRAPCSRHQLAGQANGNFVAAASTAQAAVARRWSPARRALAACANLFEIDRGGATSLANREWSAHPRCHLHGLGACGPNEPQRDLAEERGQRRPLTYANGTPISASPGPAPTAAAPASPDARRFVRTSRNLSRPQRVAGRYLLETGRRPRGNTVRTHRPRIRGACGRWNLSATIRSASRA